MFGLPVRYVKHWTWIEDDKGMLVIVLAMLLVWSDMTLDGSCRNYVGVSTT